MSDSRRSIAVLVIGAVAFCLPLVFTGTYMHNVLAILTAYAIGAVGYTMLLAAGQLSFAHASFMAVGGYTSGFLSLHGVPLPLSILAGGMLGALLGFFLGFPALRLQGQFLALITVIFALAVPQVVMALVAVTGGGKGMLTLQLGADRTAFWIALGTLVVLAWVALNIMHSRPGRALRNIKDSELSAQTMGVDITWVKTGIFALASFYAGVSGALATHITGYIGPGDFGMWIGVEYVAICVVGGRGSIPGAIVGAIVLKMLGFVFSGVPSAPFIIEGFLLVVMILFFPAGLAGLVKRLVTRYRLTQTRGGMRRGTATS